MALYLLPLVDVKRIVIAAVMLLIASCASTERERARQEIVAQYNKIAEANARKDLDAELAIRAPDFSARFPMEGWLPLKRWLAIHVPCSRRCSRRWLFGTRSARSTTEAIPPSLRFGRSSRECRPRLVRCDTLRRPRNSAKRGFEHRKDGSYVTLTM
jgi:hypothetical protein